MKLIQISNTIKYRTIYLAVYEEKEEEQPELHWGIVDFYEKIECHCLVDKAFVCEECDSGFFRRFLCQFEIKTFSTLADYHDALITIDNAGRQITKDKFVSELRKQQTFGSLSVALDVLAQLFDNVAGDKSTELEGLVVDAAAMVENGHASRQAFKVED